MVDAKKLKAAIKEGGKKGVDMSGLSDMGGVKFFHLAVEEPEDNWELLDALLQGMNAEVDEGAEERKGGAGGIGKTLLSAGKDKLLMLLHVPKALAEEKSFDIKEWAEAVSFPFPGAVKTVLETDEIVKLEVPGNPDAGKYPLKMRDEVSGVGYAYLKKKGLVPDADSDDDFILDPEAAGIDDW